MAKRGKVLVDAITECERFLTIAKAYKPDGYDSVGRAATKRASMDATRALARLRKADSDDWSTDDG